MTSTVLPEIVIVVGGTHWHCVTCKLHNKRTVSLDDHLKHSHPYIRPPHLAASANLERALSDGEEFEDVTQVKGKGAAGRRATKNQRPLAEVSQWLKQPDFGDSSSLSDRNDGDRRCAPDAATEP